MSSGSKIPDSLARSQLITAKQVGQILNLSSVHVRRLAKAGKLPPARTIGGRKQCWLATEIEAIIAASPAVVEEGRIALPPTSDVTPSASLMTNERAAEVLQLTLNHQTITLDAWYAALKVALTALSEEPQLRSALRAAEAREQKLREALTFYADRHSWRSVTVPMCGCVGESSATNDSGERARRALGGSNDA